MLARLILALGLAAIPAIARAQAPFLGIIGTQRVPAGASYTGPGDIASGAVAWYGLRAYSSAVRGQKAINVCNSGDATCVDMSTNASSGALTITTVGGTDCSVSTCTIKKAYDQTGNGYDATQSTIANRPTLSVSCLSSLPCMAFSGSQYLQAITPAVSYPDTFSAVAKRTGNFGAQNAIFSQYTGNSPVFYFFSGANVVALYAGVGGSMTVGAADNSWHAIQALVNGGASSLAIDGSTTGGALINNGASTSLAVGAYPGGSNTLFGFMAEGGYWASAVSSGNQSSMNSNQHSYWGF